MNISKKMTRCHKTLLTFALGIIAVGMSSSFQTMANTTPAGNPIAVMERISTTTTADLATTKQVVQTNLNHQKALAASKARAKARAAKARSLKSASVAQEDAANFINTQKPSLTPNTTQDSSNYPTYESSVTLRKVEQAKQTAESLVAPKSTSEPLQNAVTTLPVSPQ